MSNDTKATIQDLKVNVNRTITVDVRKQLVQIVEQEFASQMANRDASRRELRQKELDAYLKEKKFDQLRTKLDKAKQQVELAKKDIERLGVTEDGSVGSYYGYGREKNDHAKAIDNLNERLDKAANKISEPENIKHKLITRLLMAEKMGEALVILNTVLGNGIIPTLTKADVLMIDAPKPTV